MAHKEKSFVPGLVLIAIGLILLFHQLDIFYFRWRFVYPLILLGLSAMFFVPMLSKKDRSAVFPATILLVLGLFFFIRNFDLFAFDYYFYDFEDFWPIFLIAVGLGFVVLFFVKPADWGVLIPGTVLLFFGVVFILRSSRLFYWRDLGDFWPVILIAIGLSIVIGSLRKNT